MSLRRVRRIAAYGVCRDDSGRVLMTRSSASTDNSGTWNLPGGGIDHGEHPADAVVREFAEETGLVVAVTGLRQLFTELHENPSRGTVRHQDTIVYEVRAIGGSLTHEVDESSDRADWFSPAELESLPLFDRVRTTLGVTGLPEISLPGPASVTRPVEPDPDRGQRFAAYGVVTDPAGRILLTLISDNYPGAGTWHLPGGGTDWGEGPEEGLLREIVEETAQVGRITGLLDVSNQHNPAAMGPEGRPMDWHSVRAVYRVMIDTPSPPVVGEVDGSTAQAGWFTSAEATDLRLNRPARAALALGGRFGNAE